MKIKFKEQQFQFDAADAVVRCFDGQPIKSKHFTLEKSRKLQERARRVAAGAREQSELLKDIENEIGYRNATIAITDNQILSNIRAVQAKNDIRESQALEAPNKSKIKINLTIDMETGTGKTYSYIRTMYELHKHYGWSKFIIIVPSIAIREGVFKSFADMEEHFQEIYGHKISPFIYNSKHPQDIENFASDNRISVMVINTQAFNAGGPKARGADARRIYKELDQFGTRRPIDIIAKTQPILIIDEPQSVDGPKTLKRMEDFNPMFTLRYSATHKFDYNKVYRLYALDAYRQQLVKKIQVKGVNVKQLTGTSGYLYLEQISLSKTKPPFAIVEFEQRTKSGVKKIRRKLAENANLYELSGELPAYKNHVITEINGYHNKIVVAGKDIIPGDVIHDHSERDIRSIQIRECILSHFQKEQQLFSQGIKVLSLFFIDAVNKYKIYDESGEEQAGEYAEIFEATYKQIKNEWLNKPEIDPSYKAYLQRDAANASHKGYFSVDKKNKLIDSKVKRGQEDSDDISAYELIMKNKQRLMDFNEPTRFIFSHSALKEGWDNPNVFQICALKQVAEGSEIRRRQEVGRGMRLCVNQDGIRQDFETIGEQVHEVNRLTVIASESYESFAKGLQAEIAATLKDRPTKADDEFLFNKLITNAQGQEHRITKDEAKLLNKMLYKNDIVDDDDKITSSGKEKIESDDIPVPEALESYKTSIAQLLKTVYSGEAPKPEDERQTVTLNTNNNFAKKEFQELWKKISLKTIYEVKFDSDKLIKDSVAKIDEKMHISKRIYQIKSGELQSGTIEQMRNKELMKNESSHYAANEINPYSETRYDIIGEIEAQTDLKRNTIGQILKTIKAAKFSMLKTNPEQFILQCSEYINEVKASLIINNIQYHKTNQSYDAKTVFTNDKFAPRSGEVLSKRIYDLITTDSTIEKQFARDLENSTEVVVYAKLPKSFYINTPIARYSPDWAIVIDNHDSKHIYFIAETKGSDKEADLRDIEKLKIHCAKQHFDEIGDTQVSFAQVKNYDTLMNIVNS